MLRTLILLMQFGRLWQLACKFLLRVACKFSFEKIQSYLKLLPFIILFILLFIIITNFGVLLSLGTWPHITLVTVSGITPGPESKIVLLPPLSGCLHLATLVVVYIILPRLWLFILRHHVCGCLYYLVVRIYIFA